MFESYIFSSSFFSDVFPAYTKDLQHQRSAKIMKIKLIKSPLLMNTETNDNIEKIDSNDKNENEDNYDSKDIEVFFSFQYGCLPKPLKLKISSAPNSPNAPQISLRTLN
jgi:hypothetical protein